MKGREYRPNAVVSSSSLRKFLHMQGRHTPAVESPSVSGQLTLHTIQKFSPTFHLSYRRRNSCGENPPQAFSCKDYSSGSAAFLAGPSLGGGPFSEGCGSRKACRHLWTIKRHQLLRGCLLGENLPVIKGWKEADRSDNKFCVPSDLRLG